MEWGLCVQFDGAARGNPTGPASWGVAVWYGTWAAMGFEAIDVLEAHSEPLGTCTNNVAEYAGCRYALALLLKRTLNLIGHLVAQERLGVQPLNS
eukprot:2477208-Karenia_brevis.AAC.1